MHKSEKFTIFDQSLIQNKSRVQQLFRDYNRMLIDIGYGMRRSQLKQKNLIDARSLFQNKTDIEYAAPKIMDTAITHSDGFKKFVNEQNWYIFIPCFESCVIQINKDRYFYLEIKELDTINQKLTLYAKDYLMDCEGVWTPGVSGTIHFDNLQNEPKSMMQRSYENYMLLSDVYRMIPQKQLKWSDNDYKFWLDIIVEYAVKTEEKLKKNGTDNFREFVKIIQTILPVINYQLYLHKPKPKRTPKQSSSVKSIPDLTTEPKRITRIIGPISTKSPKPPKLPTEESVRKYKVASWHCRGGMRRLKSGKLVPFKPSIHHRKC